MFSPAPSPRPQAGLDGGLALRWAALWAVFSALCLALAPACGRPDPATVTPDGQGLVLLPDDGPLGRGVTARDPRLYYHDFGRVPDGDVVTRVFRFVNRDPRDVSISHVDPGCGCTVAALRAVRADGRVELGEPIRSKAPALLTVAPGEVAEIEIKISTGEVSSKNIDKLITLRVTTDSPNGYYITLEAHILVEKPFALVPGSLVLGQVPENGGGRGKLEIVPAGQLYHELKEVLPLPEGLEAELTKEIRSGLPVWTLVVDIHPPLQRGLRLETLRIATEEAPGVPGRELTVPFQATVVGDFTAEPQRIVFAAAGDQAQRSSAEFRSLLGGQRLRLTGVELPEAQRPYLRAHLEPVDPDDAGTSLRWLITLETIPPLPPNPTLAGELRLMLDDPRHPSEGLEYVVHVR